jgi:uncharacterized OsmC-like protein
MFHSGVAQVSKSISRSIGGQRDIDHWMEPPFTEIALRSRLTLPKDADPERAKRMLEKGKNACLVTASLSVPVRLESEIVVESA